MAKADDPVIRNYPTGSPALASDSRVYPAVTSDSLRQVAMEASGQKQPVQPNTDRTPASAMPDPGVVNFPGTPAQPRGGDSANAPQFPQKAIGVTL